MVDAAADQAAYWLGRDDWDGVERAALAGLLAAPGVEQLHRLRFHALHHAGDPARLDPAIRELYAYNETHDLDPDSETTQLIDQLRSDPARRVPRV